MADWDKFYLELKGLCPELELRRNEPMARHTTFRVGGPAALMALPGTLGEAKAVLRAAAQNGVRPFFLGNGSNLLVADRGYDGLVVKLKGKFGLGHIREVNGALVSGAAVLLPQLAVSALDRGLTGLEFAQGIPGSVGGGVTMNAGAYGGEIRQVLSGVAALRMDGEVEELTAEDCQLSYRHSLFSGGDYLILSARFALAQGDREEIRARMDDYATRRKEKQPLDLPSAGSTFKRPEGHFAAALIEQCGLKGLSVGGAQVSEKHSGFVVNTGAATCDDILRLVEKIKARVFDETGVALELEVKTLGL